MDQTRPPNAGRRSAAYPWRCRGTVSAFSSAAMLARIESEALRRRGWVESLAVCLPLQAMDRWSALSQIESGDDDDAVGAAGEISRYQTQARGLAALRRHQRGLDQSRLMPCRSPGRPCRNAARPLNAPSAGPRRTLSSTSCGMRRAQVRPAKQGGARPRRTILQPL